ncbi:hypothetical protein HNR65_002586 [Desulfosalsimonas propionicica]|uniref:Uncharacterized protein n=1 Tax=Desulfosalsimonas propionicica TaxID=332175 RepID=A0A7W0HLE2_9BACT|nr:hypothetical protein [Desulfosalsimonas propionicica]MBA2882244.1 hypothetical protein [Desulfosalsimonas propionicica]
MTDEKINHPRSRYNSISFLDPAQIPEQAEQEANAIALPDVEALTREEIQQRFYAFQVRQIEERLQNEQLRSQLDHGGVDRIVSLRCRNIFAPH